MADEEIYIMDASAAVEYVLETNIGSRVATLIANARLIAPEIIDAEVLSALRRKMQRGEISEAEALDALDKLEGMIIERISSRTFMRKALELRHNITAYDALYVAIAQERGATLLTYDGPLTRAPASVLRGAVRNVSII